MSGILLFSPPFPILNVATAAIYHKLYIFFFFLLILRNKTTNAHGGYFPVLFFCFCFQDQSPRIYSACGEPVPRNLQTPSSRVSLEFPTLVSSPPGSKTDSSRYFFYFFFSYLYSERYLLAPVPLFTLTPCIYFKHDVH